MAPGVNGTRWGATSSALMAPMAPGVNGTRWGATSSALMAPGAISLLYPATYHPTISFVYIPHLCLPSTRPMGHMWIGSIQAMGYPHIGVCGGYMGYAGGVIPPPTSYTQHIPKAPEKILSNRFVRLDSSREKKFWKINVT